MVNKGKKEFQICGLARFSLKEEHLISEKHLKDEIRTAFDDTRFFPFYPDLSIVEDLNAEISFDKIEKKCIVLKNSMFDAVSPDNISKKNRLLNDARLARRLINAIYLFHKALAQGDYSSLGKRRIVIIKERHGSPTIYHVSNETTVISHIGQGPFWEEIPTLYLGLKTFDVLGKKNISTDLFDYFKILLKVEERAIETGFNHTEIYPQHYFKALNILVDTIIEHTEKEKPERIEKAVKKEKPFSKRTRDKYLKGLHAHLRRHPDDFDEEKVLKAIHSLEEIARKYKATNDKNSLFQVIRLLVSASGHDLHEVRNRANIILEKVFSPKEYDIPLAATFYNLHAGDTFNFNFELPADGSYSLRVYNNNNQVEVFTDEDISYQEYPLIYLDDGNKYSVDVKFTDYGHYDYIVVDSNAKKDIFIEEVNTSGRVNVIPNMQGKIIVEIFTDIFGHTKMYWRDESGHPGLVYNENGEVIRLGSFADITAHLDDLLERYQISALYILGVQKRGTNRQDWAMEASSSSPFSPMSLVEIEPGLGGEKEFKRLVQEAHKRDVKIIVDCVPHVNRESTHLPDEDIVYCYDNFGNLIPRGSTDGRYGSWNDGKLLNYRRFEVWEWMRKSIETLIDEYDIDGIRFDSAHAVPIMMKRNNYPFIYKVERTLEDLVEGRIIVNDRWDEHFITTGYYDSACRDIIAIPFHHYLMLSIERCLKKNNKNFFINIAECYWGHERFLARSGIVPYNSSLFKVCENILHGKSDVREIYHIYDNYFPSVLPYGTELLGILGNHDERRALNTFGHRGLRAAVVLTSFLSNVIMDFEGNAEGEGWKVFLDNIYVNWNSFEYASHRSLERFYSEVYTFHKKIKGKGYLVWANNNMIAAAMKFAKDEAWLGVFNFTENNQTASIQFDNPVLPLDEDKYYKVIDPLYSPITEHCNYYTGRELRVSYLYTTVSYTDRYKLLKFEIIDDYENYYLDFLADSFERLFSLSDTTDFKSYFAYQEIAGKVNNFEQLEKFLVKYVIPLYSEERWDHLEIGLKRIFYHIFKNGIFSGGDFLKYFDKMSESKNKKISKLGAALTRHNKKGSIIFLSAEADPFSKSGGLANVVCELPRQLVKEGEDVFVITGLYKNADPKYKNKIAESKEKYNLSYTGVNVRFKIFCQDYEVGIHEADVDGVKYYLFDHYELFDGLYWGYTAEEKLRRRIGFARCAAELICTFGLKPHFTITNDAYTGLFNGIVRTDHTYFDNINFRHTTFLHLIHNGGWQYFDAYNRYEDGFDLFNLFNLAQWKVSDYLDPVFNDRINCMAAGIRLANRTMTVSPSYARQIEYQCDGMEHLLYNVIGISNAISSDFKVRVKRKFDNSGFEKRNYHKLMDIIKDDNELLGTVKKNWPVILEGIKEVKAIKDDKTRYLTLRTLNKMMLQVERRLKVDPFAVIFVMIHRITEQKGFQLLLESSEGIFRELKFQAILGGAVSSGDNAGEHLAHGLWLLSQYYPDQVDVNIGFQEVSIPLLSADLFCMPSLNEPGGISQLEAFSTGCLVVARATGGLRDTVFPIKNDGDEITGNGFLFSDFTPWAFYDAMRRAADFFKNSSEDIIYKLRKKAESSLYFWDRPACEYIKEMYNIKEIIFTKDKLK